MSYSKTTTISVPFNACDLRLKQINHLHPVVSTFLSLNRCCPQKNLPQKDRGSEGYWGEEQRQGIVQWLWGQETLTVEAVRDHVEERYGVVSQSKQWYYALVEAGGLSYHRSEKVNPKRDEAQVLARREEMKKNWRRPGRRLSGES